MEYKCPICQSSLVAVRSDERTVFWHVTKGGKLQEIKAFVKDNDGEVSIYCSKDNSHEIPEEMEEGIRETLLYTT